jgi:hypothetical protein
VHNLAAEIAILRSASSGDDKSPAPAVFELASKLESGQLFTLHRELQIALYGCVLAVITGVGLLVKDNLDRLGPMTLIAALLAAAAVCYATAIRRQLRGQARSISGDYVLLLGALLVSAAVGYAEMQFKLLDNSWSRHLLLLAALHAVMAYWLDSKLILSVALTSFAGWLGIETTLGNAWEPRYAWLGMGWRSLLCAGVFALARAAHLRLSDRDFLAVFDHFAANLGFWGALALSFDTTTRWIGIAILTALTLYIGVRGFKRGQEIFVLYAVGYATLGLTLLEGRLLDDSLLATIVVLLTVLAAIGLLWRLRSQMAARTA